MSGAAISAQFWPGWRFLVPAGGMTVTHVGYFGITYATGPLFAAIVSMSEGTDAPDVANLTGPDVQALLLHDTGLVPHPGGDIEFPLTATLDPGWHAVVFDTGNHGATNSGRIEDGQVQVNGAQNLFSIRQEDELLYGQSSGKRLFLVGFAP